MEKKCNNCKNFDIYPFTKEDLCVEWEEKIDYNNKATTLTNRQWLESLSDEELAILLVCIHRSSAVEMRDWL